MLNETEMQAIEYKWHEFGYIDADKVLPLLSTVRELQRQVQEQPREIMALIRSRYVMVPIGWSARVKNPGPDTNLEFDGLPDQDDIQDETLAFITKDQTP